LNIEKSNYPCVDLISEDEKVYVQVSTVDNIPTKIKHTLERIRDSKNADIKNLTNIKFLMLNNESAEKVKDFIGENQIGNIPFKKADDLVTTANIIQKATDNLDFQLSLYNLLKKESDSISDCSNGLHESIYISKNIGLTNIDCLINNEYEIDRNEILNKIKSEDYKNISVQGEAGSGKSVLCRKLVENEEILLYARAERFQEETDINKIWNINIRQTLEYIAGKRVVFFIDALEFISDVSLKLELLQILYEYAKDYPKVKIITSCRTSDKNAFIKIENNYSVQIYEASALTSPQLHDIAEKYPIIKKMLNMKSYSNLLESPFYINLIVSQIQSIDNITDENQLREYIWQNIICLKDNEIKAIVEKIVFCRAKEFSLGVNATDFDTEKIKKMLSSNIIIQNGSTIRLKYDIFEDICFEQYLDTSFDKCKGEYNKFFDSIESLGRCIYRRYQIWISNKLFVQENREKFLYELIFSDKMPQKWRKQTLIGLVKSRYCKAFFDEYGQTIIDKNIITDFIKTTNLYAFEIKNNEFDNIYPYIQLNPTGEGRLRLLHLINKCELYKIKDLYSDIEKLCSDYSNMPMIVKDSAEEACIILEYLVDDCLKDGKLHSFEKSKIINRFLEPIYRMSEYSKTWIIRFWNQLIAYYKSDDRELVRLATEIIEDTLKCKHINIAVYLPKELCSLAETYWLYVPEKNQKHSYNGIYFDSMDHHSIAYRYGLSKSAADYEHGSTSNLYFDNNFFFVLLNRNFITGFNWAINFVNKAVLRYEEMNQITLHSYEIYFPEEDVKRSYKGLPEMWLATTVDHKMPLVISDLLYCLIVVLRSIITIPRIKDNNELVKTFNTIKQRIYEKSNNIALLSIISNIGMEFPEKLPGYALDLVLNIDLVKLDFDRYILCVPNTNRDLLVKEILMSTWIPNLPDRYNKKESHKYNLLRYFQDAQLIYSDEQESKCNQILDYLYTTILNNSENTNRYLLIQNMDLRKENVDHSNENVVKATQITTDEAGKDTKKDPKAELTKELEDFIQKYDKKELNTDDRLEIIDFLLEKSTINDFAVLYSTHLVNCIITVLYDKSLDKDIRERLCKIWIDGINKRFNNDIFIYNYEYSDVLFTQIETNIDDIIKNKIKLLIMHLLLNKSSNGIVCKIADSAVKYLRQNTLLAQSIFTTFVMLSEFEVKDKKVKTELRLKVEKKGDRITEKDVKFITQKQESLQNERNEILTKYLYNEELPDLSDIKLQDCDTATFCTAINCGMSLTDEVFATIVKKFITALIDKWKSESEEHNYHHSLGAYSIQEVVSFFQVEIINAETRPIALGVLFDDMDFSKFTSDTFDFYHSIFGELLPEYFDSHNDKARRRNCVEAIKAIENKITLINDEIARIELYKVLTFSSPKAGLGDWSKCPSGYTYQDKQFLNNMFSKYGGYHLAELLDTIIKLNLDKLLPEILISVRDTYNKDHEILYTVNRHSNHYSNNRKTIILKIISSAFLNFSDKIKKDAELIKAFEELLEMLVELNYEEAAIILDEFRIH
jgi:hypothetical protein